MLYPEKAGNHGMLASDPYVQKCEDFSVDFIWFLQADLCGHQCFTQDLKAGPPLNLYVHIAHLT